MSEPFELAPWVAFALRLSTFLAWLAYVSWVRPRPASLGFVILIYSAVAVPASLTSVAPLGSAALLQNIAALASLSVAIWLLSRVRHAKG